MDVRRAADLHLLAYVDHRSSLVISVISDPVTLSEW